MFEGLLETKKNIFGLDIGYKSLKIVELKKTGKNYQLRGYIEQDIPPDSLTKSGIKVKKQISDIIKRAVLNTRPHAVTTKYVVSSIPESMVFTKIIKLPWMKKEELAKAVPFEAAEFFPLPINEMNIDWHIIEENHGADNKKEVEVLVIAVTKTLVNDYLEIAKNAGLELVVMETKPIASSRAIYNQADKSEIVMVDIGAETSSISIIEKGIIKLTGIVKFGGDAVTRSVISCLKINPHDAEIAKSDEGLDLEKDEPKCSAIAKTLRPLVEEIDSTINYYQTRIKKETKIEKICLVGGGAGLPGIEKFLTKELKIPTEKANPWTRIRARITDYPTKKDALKFTTAIGSAMREL